jgi:hypothetical protein
MSDDGKGLANYLFGNQTIPAEKQIYLICDNYSTRNMRAFNAG